MGTRYRIVDYPVKSYKTIQLESGITTIDIHLLSSGVYQLVSESGAANLFHEELIFRSVRFTKHA